MTHSWKIVHLALNNNHSLLYGKKHSENSPELSKVTDILYRLMLYLMQRVVGTGTCEFNQMYHTIAATSVISLIGTFHEIVLNSCKIKRMLALRCYNTVFFIHILEIFVLFSYQYFVYCFNFWLIHNKQTQTNVTYMFGIDVVRYKCRSIRQFGHKIHKYLVTYNSIGRYKVKDNYIQNTNPLNKPFCSCWVCAIHMSCLAHVI